MIKHDRNVKLVCLFLPKRPKNRAGFLVTHYRRKSFYRSYCPGKILQMSLEKAKAEPLSPRNSVLFFCSCNKVYDKQEVRFLLCLLGQLVTWQSLPLIHLIKIHHLIL